MNDYHNLQRFIDSQSYSYDIALSEIKNKQKKSHWMWFIFPQLDLGRSETSKKFALKSKEEAIEYINHPILGNRLITISKELLVIENKSAYDIFGRPDDFKLKSCMTLFSIIQEDNPLFQNVLTKYFNGKTCWRTKQLFKRL